MNSTLRAMIGQLRSDDEALVTTAARSAGLLLERHRFRRRGYGTLGDTEEPLGDLAEVELSTSDVAHVVEGLVAHVTDRGPRTNPTVVWALGKARDRHAIDIVADVARRTTDQIESAEFLYQSLTAIAAVAPDSHKDLFLRAAKEAAGDASEFARQQVAIRGWS